jgi:hypothetical protein
MSKVIKKKVKRTEFDIEEDYQDTERPDKKPSEPTKNYQTKAPASNKNLVRKADGIKKV